MVAPEMIIVIRDPRRDRVDPGKRIYWGNLGQALRRADKLDAAIDAYRTPIRIDGEDVDWKHGLSSVYNALGVARPDDDVDGKIADYNEARRLWPENETSPMTTRLRTTTRA